MAIRRAAPLNPAGRLKSRRPNLTQMRAEPIRKAAVVGLAVMAVALLALGLVLGRGSRDAWSNAVLSSSTGVFVLLLGTLATPYLRKAVQRETAQIREDFRQQVEQIEETVVRLEELADQQEQQRSSLEGDIEAHAERISTQLSRDAVIEALETAERLNLVHTEYFRVGASHWIEGPELFLAGVDDGETTRLYLSFERIAFTYDYSYAVPQDEAAVILWPEDTPPSEIARKLLERLMAGNSAFYQDFNLAYALDMLRRSIRVGATARQQPYGSPRRLRGKLIILINDDWVLTDHGLESISDDVVVKAGDAEGDDMMPPYGHDESLWGEAQTYFRTWMFELRQEIEEDGNWYVLEEDWNTLFQ